MGIFKKAMLSTAIVSMTAVPAVASAADASKLSLSPQVRASAPAKGEKAVGSGAIVGVLAAAAVIAGIVIIADDGDDSDSN
jgi:hypothetical protein